MPTYDYRCVAAEPCPFDVELQTTIADRDFATTQPCPLCGGQLERYLPTPPGFGDPMRLGRIKPPDAFKDVLRNMKRHLRGNQINSQ